MNAAKRAKEAKMKPKRAKRESKWSQKETKRELKRAKEPSKTPLRNRIAKVSKRCARRMSAALAFGCHLGTYNIDKSYKYHPEKHAKNNHEGTSKMMTK